MTVPFLSLVDTAVNSVTSDIRGYHTLVCPWFLGVLLPYYLLRGCQCPSNLSLLEREHILHCQILPIPMSHIGDFRVSILDRESQN